MSPLSPWSFLSRVLLACAFAAPLMSAQAQTPPPAGEEPRAEGRKNQKIENIHVEDGGAEVDEVRYGGKTQSISVKPKANVPGYEVLPNDGGRERQGQSETGSGGNGPRVWNLMKF